MILGHGGLLAANECWKNATGGEALNFASVDAQGRFLDCLKTWVVALTFGKEELLETKEEKQGKQFSEGVVEFSATLCLPWSNEATEVRFRVLPKIERV